MRLTAAIALAGSLSGCASLYVRTTVETDPGDARIYVGTLDAGRGSVSIPVGFHHSGPSYIRITAQRTGYQTLTETIHSETDQTYRWLATGLLGSLSVANLGVAVAWPDSPLFDFNLTMGLIGLLSTYYAFTHSDRYREVYHLELKPRGAAPERTTP